MTSEAYKYLYVFLGGGIGASGRYFLSGAVYRWLPSNFPYGNLIVNILGCFVIGILMTSMQDRFSVSPGLRLFLTVGILGGFTTFSSFSYETLALFQDNEMLRAFLNIGSSVLGCLSATYAGMVLGRLI